MSAAGDTRVAWLVDGDDPVLVAEAVRGVIDQLLGDADRTLALEDHASDEVDLSTVVDACRTPPFLTDRRVVVVRDAGRFSTEEIGPLLAYLEDPLPTTTLVLAAGGGRLSTKLTAAVKSTGHVMSSAPGRDTRGWVRQRVAQRGLRLDREAEEHLESHLGEDVSRLPGLLDVLAAVHGEGARLGRADIEPYLGEAGATVPWHLTDAIDEGRTADALAQLHRLLGAGDRHPLVVLAVLHRHVGGLLRLDDPGIATEADAARAMGIAAGRSTFPAKKALRGRRAWGSDGIADAVGLLADAELDLKGATDLPGELVLEILVARLCRLAKVGARGGRR